jgi:hypothetical protein
MWTYQGCLHCKYYCEYRLTKDVCIVSITVYIDLPRMLSGVKHHNPNQPTSYNVLNNSKQVAVCSKLAILLCMSYQLVNNHLGRNRMDGVMVNELACSEIVGSSHDLVKPKTIKYQDNVLLGIRTM